MGARLENWRKKKEERKKKNTNVTRTRVRSNINKDLGEIRTFGVEFRPSVPENITRFEILIY